MLHVMKVQSSTKTSDLEELSFYVIPGDWMRKAWPFLANPAAVTNNNIAADWKETAIGRIEIASLLVRDHAISDEEEEERHMQEENKQTVLHELQSSIDSPLKPQPQPRKQSFSKVQRHKKPELRQDLEHGKDFFLLGPSTWKFMKLHFGFDHEVKRSVTFVATPNGKQLVVVVQEATAEHPAVYEPIPPSGRFAYESLFPGLQMEFPGNVSDDENDLPDLESKPAADMDVSKESPTRQPVLLLPARMPPR